MRVAWIKNDETIVRLFVFLLAKFTLVFIITQVRAY